MSYRSNHRRSSIKKVLLKISQNLQENTCVGVSLNNVVGLRMQATTFNRTLTGNYFLNYTSTKITKVITYTVRMTC